MAEIRAIQLFLTLLHELVEFALLFGMLCPALFNRLFAGHHLWPRLKAVEAADRGRFLLFISQPVQMPDGVDINATAHRGHTVRLRLNDSFLRLLVLMPTAHPLVRLVHKVVAFTFLAFRVVAFTFADVEVTRIPDEMDLSDCVDRK